MLQGQLLENGSVVTDGYGTMSADDYRSAVISVFYYFHEPSKLIVLSLYCVVFLLAAVSNLLVIVVIFRYQHLHRLDMNLNDLNFRLTFSAYCQMKMDRSRMPSRYKYVKCRLVHSLVGGQKRAIQ
jgi:hypothetical protein